MKTLLLPVTEFPPIESSFVKANLHAAYAALDAGCQVAVCQDLQDIKATDFVRPVAIYTFSNRQDLDDYLSGQPRVRGPLTA